MIRKTVYYSGTVQGVNFRNTARRVAIGYRVSGYVRNLPDGRVELVAEGPREEVDNFLRAVGDRMDGFIRHAEVDETEPSGEFDGFGIRY